MTVLRHSRAMARHHRQRVIKKKRNLLNQIWGTGTDHLVDGELSKFSTHHHHCGMCNTNWGPEPEKFDWRSEIAQSDYR